MKTSAKPKNRRSALRIRSLAAILFALPFAANLQANVTFTPLGDLAGLTASGAYGISADGSTIVGHSITNAGDQQFRWTAAEGMVGIGTPIPNGANIARAASANGAVIAGSEGQVATRWTAADGIVSLGTFGGAYSYAHAISGNGNIIVGQASNSGGDYRAFKWTESQGLINLGLLSGGVSGNSFASGISSDGETIVGRSTSPTGTQAYRWTQAGGMAALGDLPGSIFFSSAEAISADGNLIVGYGYSASGREAFKWTSTDGMVGLGDLSGGGFESQALAVSADGAVIVGESAIGNVGGGLGDYAAFIWDSGFGMRNLNDLLTAESLGAGWHLSSATGVWTSGNDTIVVGYGLNPNGDTEAWSMTISSVPEPSSYAICLGGVGLAHALFRRRRTPGLIAPASIPLRV